jgi:hypothetical protein
MTDERSVGVMRVTGLFAAWLAVMLVAGCRLSLWSWSSETGAHELSLPPQSHETPAPTPQASPTFESRY